MSRIGKRVLTIPTNVNVDVNENKVTVKGPKGELSLEIIKTLCEKDVEILNQRKKECENQIQEL